MKAEIRRWKERRNGELGTTKYAGLFVEHEGRPIIISRLSHGLRVLRLTDQARYEFEDVLVNQVEVPDEFIEEALQCLAADERFQAQIPHYEALMQDLRKDASMSQDDSAQKRDDSRKRNLEEIFRKANADIDRMRSGEDTSYVIVVPDGPGHFLGKIVRLHPRKQHVQQEVSKDYPWWHWRRWLLAKENNSL